MYTKPVSALPSKYTFKVGKFNPRYFGWEVVKVGGKVFEFPPGTTKHLNANFIDKIIRTRPAPMYRNLMAYELKPSLTMDGTKPGYYMVGGKLVRVGLPKPQQINHFSESVSELPDGQPIYGESGVLFHTKVGEVELRYALVSSRPLMDITTFYKNILVYTNWIDAVYLSGNESAFKLLAAKYSDATKAVRGQQMVLADGRLKSCFRLAEPIY